MESKNPITNIAFFENCYTVKTEFKRTFEALAMIKTDTDNLLKRNSVPDKFMETLSVIKEEQWQNYALQKEVLEQFTATETDNLKQMSEQMKTLSSAVKERTAPIR